MTRNELFEQIANRIVEDFLTEHIEYENINHEEFTEEIADIIEKQLAGYEIAKGCVEVLQ